MLVGLVVRGTSLVTAANTRTRALHQIQVVVPPASV